MTEVELTPKQKCLWDAAIELHSNFYKVGYDVEALLAKHHIPSQDLYIVQNLAKAIHNGWLEVIGAELERVK